MGTFKKSWLPRLPRKKAVASAIGPIEQQLTVSDFNWAGRPVIADDTLGVPLQPAGFIGTLGRFLLRPPDMVYGLGGSDVPGYGLRSSFLLPFQTQLNGGVLLSGTGAGNTGADWALLLPFISFSNRTLTADASGDTGPARDYGYTSGTLKGGRAFFVFIARMGEFLPLALGGGASGHGGYYTITDNVGGVTAETDWFENRKSLLVAQLADFEAVSGYLVLDDNGYSGAAFANVQAVMRAQVAQVAAVLDCHWAEVSDDAGRGTATAAINSAAAAFFGV